MIKRATILEAAARLFGDHGYDGATTRRIALEAGVSEVTLFRQFGTKEALLREALGPPVRELRVARLPETPQNPERELVVWCAAYLRQLRAARKAIRKSMGEFADRPRVARRTVSLPVAATRVLREYLERASRLRVLASEFDVTAAATVLSGVLLADAIGRDLMPDEFPRPAREAHKVYVRIVLRGIAGGRPAGKLSGEQTTVGRRREGGARSIGLISRVGTGVDRRLLSAVVKSSKATIYDRRRSAGTSDLTRRAPSRRSRGKG